MPKCTILKDEEAHFTAFYILRPDEQHKALTDVRLDALWARGVRGLLLDLDNTLVRWRTAKVGVAAQRWVSQAKERGIAVCIASNNHTRRADQIASALGIGCYAPALKPFGRMYRHFAKQHAFCPAEVAVIGDQLFTDVLGGRLHGMYTILVEPLDTAEFFGTKLTRRLESLYKKIAWK